VPRRCTARGRSDASCRCDLQTESCGLPCRCYCHPLKFSPRKQRLVTRRRQHPPFGRPRGGDGIRPRGTTSLGRSPLRPSERLAWIRQLHARWKCFAKLLISPVAIPLTRQTEVPTSAVDASLVQRSAGTFVEHRGAIALERGPTRFRSKVFSRPNDVRS